MLKRLKKALNDFESGVLKNSRAMRLILICEALILIVAVNLISQSVILNRDDEKIIEDSGVTDVIRCTEGRLYVNSVNVGIPADSNVSYDIAYSWGPDDTDLPSVPHAAIASFAGDNDTVAYDISLYRDSLILKADIPKGKTVDNWFDDWIPAEDEGGDPSYTQECVKTGNINGFLISSTEQEDAGAASSGYSVKTFYFAQKRKDGIGIYILEGILYEPGKAEEFSAVFDQCMGSIKLKK